MKSFNSAVVAPNSLARKALRKRQDDMYQPIPMTVLHTKDTSCFGGLIPLSLV